MDLKKKKDKHFTEERDNVFLKMKMKELRRKMKRKKENCEE